MRPSQRESHQLRQIRITRHYTKHAEGSVLIECGDTKVICTASVEEKIPPHKKGSGGWLYRDSGAGVRRVHCADAGIAAPNDDAWAPVCTFEQGPLCVGRCDGQDAVVLANTHSVAVVRDGVVSAPLNRKLHNRLPDEVHAFVEGGRARVVVGCYGGVSLFEDQTLNRPTKERVLVGQTDRAQCYLMRGRGAMVAMALQQDWDENEHTVMVLDLVSGWTRCVRARGHINDMAWTPDGKLVALCSKAVFVVGGPPMAL